MIKLYSNARISISKISTNTRVSACSFHKTTLSFSIKLLVFFQKWFIFTTDLNPRFFALSSVVLVTKDCILVNKMAEQLVEVWPQRQSDI